MSLIKELIDKGYKYLIVPTRCTKTFKATKAEMINNDFEDNAEFDEFTATNDYEKAVIKVFDKNTFIKLV